MEAGVAVEGMVVCAALYVKILLLLESPLTYIPIQVPFNVSAAVGGGGGGGVGIVSTGIVSTGIVIIGVGSSFLSLLQPIKKLRLNDKIANVKRSFFMCVEFLKVYEFLIV